MNALSGALLQMDFVAQFLLDPGIVRLFAFRHVREETTMAVDTSPRTTTWTHVEGEWLTGNPPLIGPTSHAMWLASTVFDGARWFDGIAPDLDLGRILDEWQSRSA